MRWWWIDKFVEFQSGKSAKTVKNVSLSEEQLEDYFPGHPVMPHSLIIEGLAQTGGLLIGQLSDYERHVVLAKISKAKFYFTPRPGDQLVYTARLENIQADGALIRGTSHCGEVLQAEIDLYFAYLDNRDINRQQFIPGDFMRMLRIFKLFEVGVDADGQPLKPPAALVEAERKLVGLT